MLVGVGDEGFAAVEIPFPPGSDDLDLGVEMVVGQFKPDLVVAFAGGAMADGIGFLGQGDLHLLFGDQRTGDGSAKEITPLVDGVGAEHGEDEITDELFAQILNIAFAGAGFTGFFGDAVEFLTLAEVGGEGNDFTAVFLDEPAYDDGGVESARIGQDSLFDSAVLGHGKTPSDNVMATPVTHVRRRCRWQVLVVPKTLWDAS
jgi:hypothetical protein